MGDSGFASMEEETDNKKAEVFLPASWERRLCVYIPIEDPIATLRAVRENIAKTEFPPRPPSHFYPIIITFPNPIVLYASEAHSIRFVLTEKENRMALKLFLGEELFLHLRRIKYGLAAIARKMSSGRISLRGFLEEDTLIEAYFSTLSESGLSMFDAEYQHKEHVISIGTQFSREKIWNYLNDVTLRAQFALKIHNMIVEQENHEPMQAIVYPELIHVRVLSEETNVLKHPVFARTLKIPSAP